MKKNYYIQVLTFCIAIILYSCKEKPKLPILSHQVQGALVGDNKMLDLSEKIEQDGWKAAGAEVYFREIIGTPEFYLDDVGHIAQVKKTSNELNIDIYLNACRVDSFNLSKNVIIPKIVPRDFMMYDSLKVASATIMGLSGSISKKESMKYEAKTILSSSVSNKDLDFSKIPSWAECNTDTCSFWIVKDVSLREVYYRKFSLRDKKIEVRELPYIGNALSASGKFWTSNINENEVAKYFVIYRLMKFRKTI